MYAVWITVRTTAWAGQLVAIVAILRPNSLIIHNPPSPDTDTLAYDEFRVPTLQKTCFIHIT